MDTFFPTSSPKLGYQKWTQISKHKTKRGKKLISSSS